MNPRRFLAIYVIVFVVAAVIAFWRYPYPNWDLTGGIPMTGSLGCCPWAGPMQTGLLHVPREMRDRDSYLAVLVAGGKVPLDSLRVAGERALGAAGSWDTVEVPLADQLELRVSGFFFAISPLQPGRRTRVLRERAPLVWSWEVVPEARGRRWLNVGGSVWIGDTLPLYFEVASAEVAVAGTRWGHVLSVLRSGVLLWLAPGALLPTGVFGLIFDWWKRRRRRLTGFGR